MKVLESLYAYHQTGASDIQGTEKQLIARVQKVYELYLYLLSLPAEVADFSQKDAAEKAERFIPSKETNGSSKLLANRLIVILKRDQKLKKALASYKVSHETETELIRSVFRDFKSKAEYSLYTAHQGTTFEQDAELVQLLFKKVICKNPLVEQQMEEKNISWSIDKDIVEGMVNKTLKTSTETDGIQLLNLTSNWEEDEDYVRKLFRTTLENESRFETFIADKTENWDVDRIALLDTILMKMAICEMLYFPFIPVKVSINEYIDLSKEFSTPKSKVFINGILDKVLIELKNLGEIRKTGRGLID